MTIRSPDCRKASKSFRYSPTSPPTLERIRISARDGATAMRDATIAKRMRRTPIPFKLVALAPHRQPGNVEPGRLPARWYQLCRWECLLNATAVYDHVAPFARRAIPKRRNHRTPPPASLDDRIAMMKDLRIHRLPPQLNKLLGPAVSFASGGTEATLLVGERQSRDGG